MKYFITDIHGDFKGMKLLFKHAAIDFSKDQLVVGGDMINRGKESAKVVKDLKALAEQYLGNVICLLGNHEEMMGDFVRSGDRLWLSHGGRETLAEFERTFSHEQQRAEHMEWAYNLPLLYEDDEFVYTHAGLNLHEPLNNQSRDIVWMPESEFYRMSPAALSALSNGKPIVHGHTPVERIYFDGVRLNCDLGSNTYSVLEERGLGLVNLSKMSYVVYKQVQKKIVERSIPCI